MSKIKDKRKKEKSISIADILMVMGFMALLFTTFLGSKLLYGDFTRAAITTIAVGLIAALFLWLLCTAKKAQNHRQNWLIVEIASLIVFVVLFIFLTGETRHFIYISEHKSDLVTKVKYDKEKISGLFEKYEKQENADIEKIKGSIESIPANCTLYADTETRGRLDKWTGDNTIKSGHRYQRESIKKAAAAYERVLSGILIDDSYTEFRKDQIREIDRIVSSLETGADYDEYFEYSRSLEKKYKDIGEELTRRSNQPQKYNLTFHDDNRYDSFYSGKLTSELLPHDYTANPDDLEFPKLFNGEQHSNTAGWILTFGMLIFILCAYFATVRSRRVTVLGGGIFKGKKNTTNDGGIDLC